MAQTFSPPLKESFARWMSYGTEWPAGSLPASIAPTPRHSWLRIAYLHSISLSTAYRLHTLHVLWELSRPRTPLPLDYPLTSPHHGHFKLPSGRTLLLESQVSIGPSPGAPFTVMANPEYDYR